MSDKYILDGKIPKKTDNLIEWIKFIESIDSRQVARTNLTDDIYISTVFLGIDHAIPGFDTEPVLFETLVFGGPWDGECERYCSWEQAEKGHKRMCKKILEAARGG